MALSVVNCGGGGGGGGAGKAGTTTSTSTAILLGTPASQPLLIPPTGNPTQVTFLSMVTGSARPPTYIDLEQVDAQGNYIATVAQLRDDGQLADLTRGDRIFSGTVTFTENTSAEKNYRVSTVYNGTKLTSRSMNFWISGCPATSRPSDPAQAVFDTVSNSQIFANEVLIRTKEGVAPDVKYIDDNIAGIAGVGGRVVGCIPASRQFLLEITNPHTPGDATGVYSVIHTLLTLADVEAAYPNGQSLAEPISPLTSSLLCDGSTDKTSCQWYLDKVRAPQAWALAGAGDPQMAVSLIDFGVDCTLNALPCDPAQSNSDPIDHGTGVAGLLASPNNSTGMVGAAYNTYLYPYSFLGQAGSQYKMDELVNAALSQTDVRVINISAATGADFDGRTKAAICHAIGSGRLVVAAAGNPVSPNCQYSNIYPARYNAADQRCDNGADLQGGLLVVGATDINNNLASWSDNSQTYCSNQKYVNLYAPGKDLITLSTQGTIGNGFAGYTTKSGTSYATPLVSAAAAVLWSAHPAHTAQQIHDQLISSANRLSESATLPSADSRTLTQDNRMVGKPLLDMYRAVGGVDTIAVPDVQPTPFTIPAKAGAALQSDIISDPITITGIDSPTPITVQDGFYSINGGSFTNAAGSVSNGDQVQVLITSPADPGTTVSATLKVGDQTQQFTVTTVEGLTTLDFAFIPQTNAARGIPITSNTQTINGIATDTPIHIVGGSYALNGSNTFTIVDGVINSGDTVRVQLTSDAEFGRQSIATLAIGTVSRNFIVTTEFPDTTPDAFWDPTINSITGQEPSTVISAPTFTVSGLNTDAAISVSAGDYLLDSGESPNTGTVHNGQTVTVQLTTSDKSEGVAAVTLTIGNLSRTFTAITKKFILVPNDFTFAPKTGVATDGSAIESDPVQISGINMPVDISISGSSVAANAQYAISSDGITFSNFTNAVSQISPGQFVKVLLTAPTTTNSAVSATLTIGTKTGTFVISTQGADAIPDAFSFTPPSLKDVASNTQQSATTIISGINTDTLISISADIPGSAQYSLDNINFFTSGTITNTDIANSQTVYVHLVSAPTAGTANIATLNINGVTNTFTVTTLPEFNITGAVNPAGSGTVDILKSPVLKNESTTATVTPAIGYHIGTVAGLDSTGVTACTLTNPNVNPTSGATTYDVTNFTNNCIITATFNVNDTTPPVITMNGPNPMTVLPGDTTYADPGATALDNVDGDIAVTTTSNVDINTVGKYSIIYSATDTAGNNATATRTVYVGTPFVTTWKTDNLTPGSTADNQIKISTQGTGYNYNIDWGDGTSDIGVTGDIIHTYATTTIKTYTVSISGAFPRIYFNAGSYDNAKLISVDQWGTNPWQSMGYAFYGCANLVFNATDAPDLSQVLDMSYMFYDATNFDSDISGWNVSTVTDMSWMFGVTAFNQNINGWDVSSVTNMQGMFFADAVFNKDLNLWGNKVALVKNMSSMFYRARAFNGNITTWNVSSVTDMSFMFNEADVFNQDISAWTVSSVTNMRGMFSFALAFSQKIGGWDVSSVTNMSQMFSNAIAFNEDLSAWANKLSLVTNMSSMFEYAIIFDKPIGSWDVSNVTDMSQMFYGASAFNQDLSAWGDKLLSVTSMISMFSFASTFDQNISLWNVTSVTDMAGMFYGAKLSVANYDALLNSWSAQAVHSNVLFDGGNSQYSTAAQAAHDVLTGSPNLWVITDGGLATMFTVTAINGRNGAITPTQSIPQGTAAVFTITPDPNYRIESVTGCNGTLNLVDSTYTTDLINADCTVNAVFTTVNPIALYPANGLHWNDYVFGSDIATATDTACNASVDTTCIHAGELRAVEVTGQTSCAGLTATDALGAFTWVCDINPGTGNARMKSTGLAPGKHLSDLIDFATPTWKNNTVTVSNGSGTILTTPSTQWWSNPVTAAGDGSAALNAQGTIYTVGSTATLTAGYVISASKVGLIAAPGVNIQGPGSGANVIDASSVDHLWLEGQIDASADGIGVNTLNIRHSRLDNINIISAQNIGIFESGGFKNTLSNVTTSSCTYGIYLLSTANDTVTSANVSNNSNHGIVVYSSSNNTLSAITSSVSFRGLYVYDGSNNVFTDIDTSGNTSDGIYLVTNSNTNTFSNIIASNNGGHGINISGSSYNALANIKVSNNAVTGVRVGDFSDANTLSAIRSSNNKQYGVLLSNSKGNHVSDVVATNDVAGGVVCDISCVNNSLSRMTISNTSDGISLNLSTNNTLSGITVTNSFRGFYLYGSSKNNSFSNIATSNNNYDMVLTVTSDGNYFEDLTLSDSDIGITLDTVSNETFTGLLQVTDQTKDCSITGGTNPGINSDCTPQLPSSFTLINGVTLATSFVGKINPPNLSTSADLSNTSADANGAATYPTDASTFDWTTFDNPFRGWGVEGGVAAFPDFSQRNRWASGPGHIWDWSLLTKAPATSDIIWNVFTAPTDGNNTLTHVWNVTPAPTVNADCVAAVPGSTINGATCESTFLKYAVEILNDGIGNDNGLCESNETCLFTPNMGSYQGHGNLISAGTFVDGALTGITLMQYDTNGY